MKLSNEIEYKKPTIFESNMIYLFIYVLIPWIFNLLFKDIEIISRVIIIQYFIFLLPIIIYTKVKAYPIQYTFKLNKLNIKQIIFILLIALFITPFASFLNNIMATILLIVGKSLPHNQGLVELEASKNLLLILIITTITPGICEEFFFRGFLMSSYSKYKASQAIIITSFLFGIFHFDIQNLLSTIFIAAIFSYMVYKTNSLFASILAHITFNSLASILQYFYVDINQFPSDIDVRTQFLATVTGGIVAILLGFVAYILLKRLPKSECSIFSIKNNGFKENRMSLKDFLPLIIVVLIFIFQIVQQLS